MKTLFFIESNMTPHFNLLFLFNGCLASHQQDLIISIDRIFILYFPTICEKTLFF